MLLINREFLKQQQFCKDNSNRVKHHVREITKRKRTAWGFMLFLLLCPRKFPTPRLELIPDEQKYQQHDMHLQNSSEWAVWRAWQWGEDTLSRGKCDQNKHSANCSDWLAEQAIRKSSWSAKVNESSRGQCEQCLRLLIIASLSLSTLTALAFCYLCSPGIKSISTT